MTCPHTVSGWISLGTAVSTAASVACNLLPNANVFDNYPRVQKAYGTFINILAVTAANIRHCLPSLDVEAPFLGIRKKLPADS